MCFISVLMLRRAIDVDTLAGILNTLGYTTEIRESGGRRVVEARRGRAVVKSLIDGNKLKIETNDYGLNCLRDLDELIKTLYEDDLKPEVIEINSPYIYAYERRGRKAKKFFDEIGVETTEIYSGYCG